jgi:uncharacterized protein YndB with AHSA1/START domain
MAAPAGNAAAKEVLITRVFDAPRELVFRAWTDPDRLRLWYAPNGCTLSAFTGEIRSGGTFLSCIRIPDGTECWCKGVYLDVVKNERLVYTMRLSDPQGRDVETKDTHLSGHSDWPAETTVTVTFENLSGKTKITLHQTVQEEVARRTGAYPSWLQMFDRLAADLAKT